jgi:hypothetical protein
MVQYLTAAQFCLETPHVLMAPLQVTQHVLPAVLGCLHQLPQLLMLPAPLLQLC